MVRYQPDVRIDRPAKFQWNESGGHFVTKYAERPREKMYTMHTKDQQLKGRYSLSTAKIAVTDLEYPGTNYYFHFEKIGRNERNEQSVLKANITVRTADVLPTHAPKAGAGCFQVLVADGDTRQVKLYWQPCYGRYALNVYQQSTLKLVYSEIGHISKGFTWINVSHEAHYAVLKGYSEAGVSKEFSVIHVPSEMELIKFKADTFPVHWNYAKNRYRIRWQTPDIMEVTNYTLFWVDDEEAPTRIQDFVYIPNNITLIEVKGEPSWIELGLSVNTETSSSGLRVARPCDALFLDL